MRIRQLDPGNKRDVELFIHFPFALYRNCPLWVPPLISSARAILNRRKHPFYQHSTADFFVIESEGQTLGRIAMLDNRNYNAYRQSNTAFFGYFEVVEDIEAARRPLEAGVVWAKERGLNQIIGPRGVIGVDGSVLVEGFEHRPALGIPYNYAYYDAFIKDAGFEKDTDYLSGYRLVKSPLPERFQRIAQKVKQRRGFWIKQFASTREIRRWIPRLLDLHHQAMGRLHSFYPPTEAETALVIDTLLTMVDPRLVKLIMQGHNIVGFILAYHDISAALQRAKGRLWPFGWYHILRERQRTKWVNVNVIGLLPKYRGLGGNALLYVELEKTLNALDLEHIDMVQIEENNLKSRADLEAVGVTWYKRHRHYRRQLQRFDLRTARLAHPLIFAP